MSSRTRALPDLHHLLRGGTAHVDFITPLFAVGGAALRTRGPLSVLLSDRARSYASTIGLDDALVGREPQRPPERGRSYSALARLDSAAAVERCSEVIDDFVYEQLAAHERLARGIARVVGELHDNVASHARGVGFSAAQRFGTNIEIAVADAGRGMLSNVRRKVPAVSTHEEALAWCLQRGNTTADAVDEMAQWLPDDAACNPYPPTVKTVAERHANHHMGEGLWQLQELVRTVRGSLLLWTGDARIWVDGDGEKRERAPDWQGLIIEMTLPVAGGAGETGEWTVSDELEALAKRLGI